ncbi:MAG: FAD:protein FMN transferase [Phaeovulum sp.]|nr:FAD:protein FMN transferase [Phaeovulum sp.]MDP2064118.1 FAD:protein FMN transferase [Phaeovulum sp.]
MSKTSTSRLALCGPAMAAEWSAVCYAPAARGADLTAALAAALEAVERQMSNWRPGSDLNRLNAAPPGAWVALPADLLAVLAEGLAIGAASGGAFDMALGDLVAAWGFGPPARRPDEAAIRALTGQPRRPCAEVLELADGRARRLAPVRFDLSGIAKGYGVDAMARVMEAQGIADWLVGIDGEMRAGGSRPDGAAWSVAIEAAEYESPGLAGTVALCDRAIASSGDYRNWIGVGAARLGHIMHPARAAPLQNGVAAVSVLAPSCCAADAWATALMVLGAETGAALARARGLDALFQLREGSGLRFVGTGAFA